MEKLPGCTEDCTGNTNKTKDPFVSTYCQVLEFTDTKGNTKEMYFPKKLDLERPKRSRTNFTLRQLRELEKTFAKNQYLVGKERKSLSRDLDLSEAQIKIWYQNRRTKQKKEELKEREKFEKNAETIAKTNIMKLLQESHQNETQELNSTYTKTEPVPESGAKSSQTSSFSLFNPTTDSNLFFYTNSHWNETNYLNSLYFSSLLHK